MERSDEELVQLSLDSCKEAFGELVHRYYAPLYGWILSQIKDMHTAEDLTQEAFMQAYRSLRRCRKPSNFAGWLFGIAKHMCLRWYRYCQRHLPVSYVSLQRLAEYAGPAAQDDTMQSKIDALHKAIPKLSQEYHLILSLKHLHGMSCKEIASVLGKPIGTVTG
jgi:RNA polymerase sigma-70 factor (ECF subfamily)